MEQKKQFVLTVARVVWPSQQPIIAVLLPWDHFCHKLGPTAYGRAIASGDAIPIAVSIAPDGRWASDAGMIERVWAKACEQTPPDKLQWHEATFEGDDPRSFLMNA